MVVRASLLGMAALGLTATVSYADWSYRFETPVTSYTATPSSTILVPIYLYERAIAPTTGSQIAAEDGLWSAGVAVRRDSGTAALAQLVASPVFDDTGMRQYSTAAGLAKIWEYTLDSYHGALPESLGGDVYRVAVAQVPVTVGGVAGTTSTFTLMDADATHDTSSALNLLTLDPVETYSFSVAVTPEPASLGLLAPVALLAFRRRR